jgi:hypothetical protein
MTPSSDLAQTSGCEQALTGAANKVSHTPGPWKVKQVRDHFIVWRWYPQGGHDTLSSPGARRWAKFRSEAAAEQAIRKAVTLDAYEQACRLLPEEAAGHLDYYARQLAREFNCREVTARSILAKATGRAA